VKRLLQLVANDQGATAVEYAVILGLIVLVLLGSVALVGQKSHGIWSSVQTQLSETGVLK
jgi:pilus assembly protein Flp/PilA